MLKDIKVGDYVVFFNGKVAKVKFVAKWADGVCIEFDKSVMGLTFKAISWNYTLVPADTFEYLRWSRSSFDCKGGKPCPPIMKIDICAIVRS